MSETFSGETAGAGKETIDPLEALVTKMNVEQLKEFAIALSGKPRFFLALTPVMVQRAQGLDNAVKARVRELLKKEIDRRLSRSHSS